MMPQPHVERGSTPEEYSALVQAVDMIARHPDFPDKPEIVRECVRDIDERGRDGRLTASQHAELLNILLRERPPVRTPAKCAVRGS